MISRACAPRSALKGRALRARASHRPGSAEWTSGTRPGVLPPDSRLVWIYLTNRLYGLYDTHMGASIRKRTYNLDGEMIERVRRLYNAKTDTEAIQTALRKAIDDREIEEALGTLLRAGRFRTVYR